MLPLAVWRQNRRAALRRQACPRRRVPLRRQVARTAAARAARRPAAPARGLPSLAGEARKPVALQRRQSRPSFQWSRCLQPLIRQGGGVLGNVRVGAPRRRTARLADAWRARFAHRAARRRASPRYQVTPRCQVTVPRACGRRLRWRAPATVSLCLCSGGAGRCPHDDPRAALPRGWLWVCARYSYSCSLLPLP